MPKIKTFEQACKALKIKPELPVVTMLPEKHQKAIIAFYKLTVIIEALNEGWVPNWNDNSEWKYYNYFWVDASKETPSGFGFSDSSTYYASTLTGVGARLCFKSSELAEYARKQKEIIQLYKEYLLIS